MDDTQNVALIRKIIFSNLDWMQSYRETFGIRDGTGLPSGLTHFDAVVALILRVADGKPVVIKEKVKNEDPKRQ